MERTNIWKVINPRLERVDRRYSDLVAIQQFFKQWGRLPIHVLLHRLTCVCACTMVCACVTEHANLQNAELSQNTELSLSHADPQNALEALEGKNQTTKRIRA